MLKETLLQYNFIDNIYLDQYLELISNVYTETNIHYENHHVIPACFFNSREEANNSNDQEIVSLPYKYHVKAHWLLTKCTAGQENEKLIYSFEKMLNRFGLTYVEFINKAPTETELSSFQAAVENYYAYLAARPPRKYKKHKCRINSELAEYSNKTQVKRISLKQLDSALKNQKVRGYGHS